MIKKYIYKVIISFIALKCSCLMTKDNYQKIKTSKKRNGFIKRNINCLIPCFIPIFRWILIAFVLSVGFALENDSFCNKVEEEYKKKGLLDKKDN